MAQSTVSEWLKKIREAKAEEQRRQILELYLQGFTHEEIADKIGFARLTVTEIVGNIKSDILRARLSQATSGFTLAGLRRKWIRQS